MSQFEGKVALITGGTSGIGRATAIAFAREGAKVVIGGRRAKEGTEVVGEIQRTGGEAIFVETDVSIEESVKNLVAATVKKFRRIDFAFNNAGIESPLAQLFLQRADDFDKVMSVNARGVFLSMKYEIPAMLESGGVIINTSSIWGKVGGSGGISSYIASKHAVEGLTKSAALELARSGIRVNAVSPAGIETEMSFRVRGKSEDARKQFAEIHPMGRVGTVDEVASAVIYLCSDAAKFMTGVSLPIDGGWTTR